MPAMSESFVDLSYRGLALARRVKLTQVRPASGYLEMPAPMPVGTTIGIATDEGVLLEAQVTEVHEQVSGSERPPGMLVKPNLAVDAAESWWRGRLGPGAEREKQAKPAPPADADGKVTVVSPRMSGQAAVPELVDDGRSTAVMEAIRDNAPDTEIADVPHDTISPPIRDTTPAREPVPVEDESKRTMAMDAVDLAALGLGKSTEALPAIKPEDYALDDGIGGDTPRPSSQMPDGSEPTGGKAKKKRKRR
jgi:hypothetical protein